MRLVLATVGALAFLVFAQVPGWAQMAPGAPRGPAPVGEPEGPEAPLVVIPPSGTALLPPGDVSSGYYLIPSLRLTEEFDSNIFATSSNRQWDIITRFSPGLSGGYRSEPFTLLVNGGFGAAIYPRHPDLTDPTQGWHLGLDPNYPPTRPLALGLTVSHLKTETHSTLIVRVRPAPTVHAPAPVLEFGLVRATFLTVAPSVAYQFTPRTWGTAEYDYVHDTIEGGVDTSAHNVELRLYHKFSSVDTGVL